jgi:hypothetical protein
MLHLEFPPEFVHVAFTHLPVSGVNLDFVSDFSGGDFSATDLSHPVPQVGGSKFAVMGDYGNHVNIYDSQSFILNF